MKLIFLVLLLVSIGSAQFFTGGRLDHLDTGTLNAIPVDTTAGPQVISTFVQALSRVGIFDDTDTSIFIATCKLL